jgi:hypothetical protein
MGTRTQAVEPFHMSQGPSTEKPVKSEPTKVRFKMAQVRNIGQPDMLSQSLTTPPREFMNIQHFAKRKIEAGGHHYAPDGEFGRPTGRMKSKATDYGKHPGGRGENPIGSPPNRKGDNALGRAMNKIGSNVLGKPSRRPGQNPLGNNSNRSGQKSGYPHFAPRGGGKNV